LPPNRKSNSNYNGGQKVKTFQDLSGIFFKDKDAYLAYKKEGGRKRYRP
jgi:hypothetical protein